MFAILFKQSICNIWPRDFFFQYAIQRARFDECVRQTQAGGAQHVLDGPGLCLLARQLIFFYRQTVDAHRLVRMLYLFDALQLLAYVLFHKCYYSQWHNLYFTNCFCFCVFVKTWLCQNLVKHNSQFVKLLLGPQKQTCIFQIKRILGFCCRYST